MINDDMNKYDDYCPCVGCEYECDDWEARYCCDLYQWLSGVGEPDCDDCDTMDI